jgi:hypothetical protein
MPAGTADGLGFGFALGDARVRAQAGNFATGQQQNR